MTPKAQTALIIAGFALLSTIAVAGWTRNPSGPDLGMNANRVSYGQPVSAIQDDRNCNEVLPAATEYTPVTATGYQTSNRPRVIQQEVVREVEPARQVVVRKKQGRSTKKSVAIVGGAAGAGAAIGALAGGGKGAAIGALSGGGAGLVYDRLTHKR